MMKRSKTIEQHSQTAIEKKSKLLKNIEESDRLKLHSLPYHTNRLVVFDNISIFYDKQQVCADMSFCVDKGDRIALCGKNGSGKSSILKLICGEEITYTGSIYRGSKLKISYVSQDTSFLFGDLKKYAKGNKIDESLFKAILSKLDFSRVQFDKDMSDFSDGQKKKVLIAKSLCESAHLYIWDEPLNFIDVLSRIQIEELIMQYEPTMLFVEHDKTFADTVATKTIEL
jgi:lincosamide and streptogramin A transport system ATP-binding/permease protein